MGHPAQAARCLVVWCLPVWGAPAMPRILVSGWLTPPLAKRRGGVARQRGLCDPTCCTAVPPPLIGTPPPLPPQPMLLQMAKGLESVGPGTLRTMMLEKAEEGQHMLLVGNWQSQGWPPLRGGVPGCGGGGAAHAAGGATGGRGGLHLGVCVCQGVPPSLSSCPPSPLQAAAGLAYA